MAYNQNIPQAGDLLSTSQNDLLNNFQAIKTLIDVDHVDFASSNNGKHNKVTFPVQAVAPAFGAGELGFYSLLPVTGALTGVNETYLTKSTGTRVALSASILSYNTNPGSNVAGWTNLPSGIILKWGDGTVTGNQTFAFPVAANTPVFTQVMSMLVVPYSNVGGDPNIAVTLISFTNLGFTLYGSPRITSAASAAPFQYLAIGY